ncbi:MAG: exodeoxyribonuclease V subunit gamma [Neisseriaceae bacterium]|nr:exodeoxyribonuclease V subunit gamma [Neisseriaceae bacterium]
MALSIFRSDKVEYLATLLASLIKNTSTSNPLMQIDVLLSSSGLRRFIDISLASSEILNGVVTNVRYDRVPTFLGRLMYPDFSGDSVYSPNLLRWRILRVLRQKNIDEVQKALSKYVEGFDAASYELSQVLADLFNQYLVYRPDWIEAWSSNKLLKLDKNGEKNEIWQARLWQHIHNEINHKHKADLLRDWARQLMQKKLTQKQKERLPEQVFLFAISSMAPLYLDVLKALSCYCDVYILSLDPCEEYRDMFDMDDHPLLWSLGKQSRDFLHELSIDDRSLELFSQIPSLPENKKTIENNKLSLLQQLQTDIRLGRKPSKNCKADSSIVLHSSYSPLRELHALKDAILDFIDSSNKAGNKVTLDDIAVLTPNIELYAPFITAVFSANAADGINLPFSISDTKISNGKPYLLGWKMLLQLFSSRFEVNSLSALLDNECVMKRFDFCHEDVSILRHIMHKASVHWGRDAQDRSKYGDQSGGNLFTWQQLIQRILAGISLPENESLWQEIAPYPVDIDLWQLMMRFVLFLQILIEHSLIWQKDANIDIWVQRIINLSELLFDTTDDDEQISSQFRENIGRWQFECHNADMNNDLSFVDVESHIKSMLNYSSDASFMRGGITFGSLIPLRSLPFKFLALLGMNSGDFPRSSRKINFDLMNNNPRAGDRSRRDDDRYLFLESIMSAREVLYLSYVGRDIKSDEILAPSELIWELGEVLSEMTTDDSQESVNDYWEIHQIQHPLQAFSPRYFIQDDNGKLPISFRKKYADALASDKKHIKDFLSGLSIDKDKLNDTYNLAWNDFVYFWRNPQRYWLEKELSWKSYNKEIVLEDREPFSVRDTESVYQAYIDDRLNGIENFDKTHQILTARNKYPANFIGEYERIEYSKIISQIPEEWFNLVRKDDINFQTVIENINFSGRLGNLYQEKGCVIITSKEKNNAPDMISHYLNHLIVCTILGNIPSVIVRPNQIQTFNPLDKDTAKKYLSLWCKYYPYGQQAPLPFFPRTSWAAAKIIYKKRNDSQEEIRLNAIKEAKKQWLDGYNVIGQGSYDENKTIWRDSDKIIYSDEFMLLCEELLLPIFDILQPID